jgi:riboflavin biosynthesis pyrimidine reductase
VPEPLELLWEAPELPAFPLPAELAELYGGTLGFPESRVIANFVSSLDGAVSLPGVPGSVQMIGGGSVADRFVMALLRSCADALLMGAGTFRASREARWTAESLYPDGAAAFADLRRRLGLGPAPELAVVTQSGRLDPEHPAFEAGVVVLTTDRLARPLARALPRGTTVVALGPEVGGRAAVEALRGRGHRLILSEGGPTMLGSLVAGGAVDELFLTLSPLLAGAAPGSERLSLIEGTQLLPGVHLAGSLMSVRRGGSHLFLRYALPTLRGGAERPPSGR